MENHSFIFKSHLYNSEKPTFSLKTEDLPSNFINLYKEARTKPLIFNRNVDADKLVGT